MILEVPVATEGSRQGETWARGVGETGPGGPVGRCPCPVRSPMPRTWRPLPRGTAQSGAAARGGARAGVRLRKCRDPLARLAARGFAAATRVLRGGGDKGTRF